MSEIPGLEKVLKFKPSHLTAPNAWMGHLPFAYWIIEQMKPAVFVELGTHTGNSYFSFCQSILENQTGTKAFAVDTWKGDQHAGFYDESVFESVKIANTTYSQFSTLIRKTFDEAVVSFEDNSINLLHIDGLHTYEAVKHDFETWLPKMKKDGIILFHDTNVHRDDFGVYKLWDEISKDQQSLEFLHSHGLGVLSLSKAVTDLIPASAKEREFYMDLFSALGDHGLIKFERDSLQQERDSLLKSISWRGTAPIRRVGSILRKLNSKT